MEDVGPQRVRINHILIDLTTMHLVCNVVFSRPCCRPWHAARRLKLVMCWCSVVLVLTGEQGQSWEKHRLDDDLEAAQTNVSCPLSERACDKRMAAAEEW